MNIPKAGVISFLLVILSVPLAASSQVTGAVTVDRRPPVQRELFAGDFRCNGGSSDTGTLVLLQFSAQGTGNLPDQGYHLRRDGAGNPSICRQLATEFGAKATSLGCTTGEVSGSPDRQVILSMVCERDRNGLIHTLGELSRAFITLSVQ